MGFKNIHSRKNFIKINELLGGHEGGVGDKDGFANNTKLKDSIIGKFVSGMFRGISWLWRKSKENFIINILIARLINELMRGVILYCFANNINLEEGTKAEEAKKVTGTENKDDETSLTDVYIEEGEATKYQNVIQDIQQKDKIDLKNLPPDILNKIGIDVNINHIVDMTDYNSEITKMNDFLSSEISNYNNMSDDDKEKFRNIYISNLVLKKVSKKIEKQKHEKLVDAQEDEDDDENEYDQPDEERIGKIYDESLVFEVNATDNIKHKIASADDSKIGLDEPRAGRVSVARKIVHKVGGAVTVGDVITKRDQEKYADKEDQFDTKIVDINLAEIEKTVQRKNDKPEVSSQVNPENLKLIQISATELVNLEKEGQNKTNLQLRWNKEVTFVYSSFVNLMDISSVDIRENFRNDLSAKVRTSATKLVTDSKSLESINLIGDSFENAISRNEATMSDIGSDKCYYTFRNESTGEIFMCSIAPVESIKDKYYLFMVTSVFTSTDKALKTVISNTSTFNRTFRIKDIPENDNVNIYFLFKLGTGLPTKISNIKGVPTNVLVLNHYKESSKDVDRLYLCKNTSGKFTSGIDISSDKIDKINIAEYKAKISSLSCRKFKAKFIEPWKKSLNFIDNNSSDKFSGFDDSNGPSFLNDEVEEKLGKLINKK